MQFKLIIALVNDEVTDKIVTAGRDAGARGATVITSARGEGLKQNTTFFGLSLESQSDVVLFLVEEHLSREILETISKAGNFDDTAGSGIAFQINVEDAVGVSHQIQTLTKEVEERL
ncbi:MAG: P-II family nitrogen regulator [Pseudomonadota bacterium]